MQILEIGYQSLLTAGRTVYQPNGFFGEFLLLTHGELSLTLAGSTVDARPGDAILVTDRTPLRFEPTQRDMFCDWMLFAPGSDRSFFESLHIPENALLRFGDTVFLSVLIEQLCAEFYAGNPRRSEMIDCLLKALLIRISETGAAVSGSLSQVSAIPRFQELVRLREKIYENPQEHWTVDMLCAEVSMSRSYFQLVYREAFGLTCIADVINCKMVRARELLTATSYTVAHIAQLCGYDSEEHFMRQFKKNNGVTPTVYRRQHREG